MDTPPQRIVPGFGDTPPPAFEREHSVGRATTNRRPSRCGSGSDVGTIVLTGELYRLNQVWGLAEAHRAKSTSISPIPRSTLARRFLGPGVAREWPSRRGKRTHVPSWQGMDVMQLLLTRQATCEKRCASSRLLHFSYYCTRSAILKHKQFKRE